MNFTPHFSFLELTNSENHPKLVEQNRKDAQAFISSGEKLSALLEEIRTLLGNKPLTINSGYRNLAMNQAVGSKAKNSAHLRFEAADIVPITMSTEQAFKLLVANKNKLPNLRKAIIEMGWIHVEVKVSPSEAQTFYTTTDGVNFVPYSA